MVSVDDRAIHDAIARVFVENDVGFNRRPILITMLAHLTADYLSKNLNPVLILKIATLIYASDKYVVVKNESNLDAVISSKV